MKLKQYINLLEKRDKYYTLYYTINEIEKQCHHPLNHAFGGF